MMRGTQDCDLFRKGYEFAQQQNASLAGMANDPMPTEDWHKQDFQDGYMHFYEELEMAP